MSLPPGLRETCSIETNKAVLAEIRRVLKPRGRLLIVDFLRPTHNFFPHPHAALQVGLQDLPALLHAAGFLDGAWKRGPFPLLDSVQGHTHPEREGDR